MYRKEWIEAISKISGESSKGKKEEMVAKEPEMADSKAAVKVSSPILCYLGPLPH